MNAEVSLASIQKGPSSPQHAAYSATTLLPGEDPLVFKNLHCAIVAELTPVGPIENDIVSQIAHLIWRKQNLAIFRIARQASRRCQQIEGENIPEKPPVIYPEEADVVEKVETFLNAIGSAEKEAQRAHNEALREGNEIAKKQAKQELGDIYPLVEIGETATLEGLMKELEVMERLDTAINKCLKQLMMVRGIKSLASNSLSPEIRALERPRKAG